MTIKISAKKIIALIGFIVFAVIVNESSNYLTGIVPYPQLDPIDLFSILHAFTAAGFAFFALILVGEGSKTKKNIFFFIIFLIVAWEVAENTILKGTSLSGGESLLNSGMDVVIGIVMSSAVLFKYSFRNEPKNNATANRSHFS